MYDASTNHAPNDSLSFSMPEMHALSRFQLAARFQLDRFMGAEVYQALTDRLNRLLEDGEALARVKPGSWVKLIESHIAARTFALSKL